jgi:hypothetical protein
MSLEKNLNHIIATAIQKAVQDFATQISQTHNIPIQSLMNLWSSKETTTGPSLLTTHVQQSNSNNQGIQQQSNSNNQETRDALNKLKKPELQTMCRNRSLKATGTKAQLIDRLLNGEQTTTQKKSSPSKSPCTSVAQPKLPVLRISKNSFGNYEHKESGLIIERGTQTAIGTQNPDGSVNELTSQSIESAKQYGFNYTIPFNLDSDQVQSTDKDVQELDEPGEETKCPTNEEEEEEEVVAEDEDLPIAEDEETEVVQEDEIVSEDEELVEEDLLEEEDEELLEDDSLEEEEVGY